MKKRLNGSRRGLTFALDDASKIGTHFRYFVDLNEKRILIVEDAEGRNTISRKRKGDSWKALIDLRDAKVKELVSRADYMEVEVLSGKIVVSVYERAAAGCIADDVISIEDVLLAKAGEIVLERAVGCDEPVYLPEEVPRSYDRTELSEVYRVLSMFSGAGLLDRPFAMDPHYTIVYGVDFDRDAAETYRRNIGDHIEVADIRTVDASGLPKADLCIGGSCCQGFSNCNRTDIDRETGKRKRHLVEDFIRIVTEKRPLIWMLENVPQLLSKEGGYFLRLLFEGLGSYEITTKLVTDSEVGGYTQRKRAIVIGSRIGKVDLPDVRLKVVRTVREALSRVTERWPNAGDISKSRPETVLLMSYVPQGGNWRDIPKEVHRFGPSTQSNMYRRLSWGEIAPTIVNWRKTLMMPPEGNRILSVSEAAALMGLDETFAFCGSLDARQQQVGNGVTQAIASYVKNAITDALVNYEKICVI